MIYQQVKTSLEKLFAGDRGLILEVVSIYLQSEEEIVVQIQNLVETKTDDGQVARLAHSLKGAVAILGVEDIQKSLKEFETVSRGENFEVRLVQWKKVFIDLLALRGVLELLRNELKNESP